MMCRLSRIPAPIPSAVAELMRPVTVSGEVCAPAPPPACTAPTGVLVICCAFAGADGLDVGLLVFPELLGVVPPPLPVPPDGVDGVEAGVALQCAPIEIFSPLSFVAEPDTATPFPLTDALPLAADCPFSPTT